MLQGSMYSSGARQGILETDFKTCAPTVQGCSKDSAKPGRTGVHHSTPLLLNTWEILLEPHAHSHSCPKNIVLHSEVLKLGNISSLSLQYTTVLK